MTLIDDRPHSHGAGSTGSPAERFTSRNPEDFAQPSGRDEDWRFTPIRALRPLFEAFEPTTRITGDVEAPDEVSWSILPRSDERVGRASQPADRVSALAWAGAPQAFVLQIPAGAQIAAPVLVHGTVEPGQAYEHMVIEAGAGSRATVVVDYAGAATVAENVEIIVGDGAALTFVSLQDWALGAVHLSAHDACLGRDATLKHVVVNLGGELVRLSTTVRYDAPGGQVELLGVSFAGPKQHFESRLYIDHSMPQCASNVLYKNALLGDTSRTVWIGDVRIRPAATGTNTYEMNRNLLLSPGARADSVPNLEIETGEIAGAGHASATGRFDDLQLFYLQSRGIDAEQAQRLVIRGFFADVVARIGLPDLQQRIMTAIEARLGFAAAEPELETTS
ncbi:MAG: Fe-S cluster assembly protein SufD [Pseudonocardiales bacterium]|nr:MAG: Fe-S cluster assembly protein SufD [Pseudonocardiales bacterium]